MKKVMYETCNEIDKSKGEKDSNQEKEFHSCFVALFDEVAKLNYHLDSSIEQLICLLMMSYYML